MTPSGPWGTALRKELRALAPVWLAVALTMLLSGPAKRIGIPDPTNLAFLLGIITLGALSVGHEYLYRTLGGWLAQPVSRRFLVVTKLTALLIMLAPLMAYDWAMSRISLSLLRLTLPIWLLFGLVLAPWFTMVARGPLGGVVLTIAAPVAFLTLHYLVTGLSGLRVDEWLIFGIAVVAAVLAWRAFMRLEVLDSEREIELPALFQARRPVAEARRGTFLALVGKEVRLQQLTIGFAVLSLLAITLAGWARHALPPLLAAAAYPLSLLHLVIVPTLAGSLGSAEERRIGILDAQVLQPVAVWKQWTLKVAVVIAISLILGVGLLALLARVDSSADIVPLRHSLDPMLPAAAGAALAFPALGVTLLSLVSLYVSSLCGSGLGAFVTSIVVLGALMASSALNRLPWGWTGVPSLMIRLNSRAWLFVGAGHSAVSERLLLTAGTWVPFSVLAGLVLILLKLGSNNHWSADRSRSRVWQQGLAIATYLAIGGMTGATALHASVTARGSTSLTLKTRLEWVSSAARKARWLLDLSELTRGFDGRVGACIADGRLYACVRPADRFPMQSVMKLLVAIAALDAVDQHKLDLDDPVVVHKSELSVFVQPLAALVGAQGFKTSIDDLIRRAVVDSDSAATDILLGKLGGPASVGPVLLRKGAPGLRVDRDEKHLQTEINGLDWRPEYVDPAVLEQAIAAVPAEKRDEAFRAYQWDPRDTAKPVSIVWLLDRLARGLLLSPASTAHLLDLLTQTTTFPNRLKAGVPDGWTLAHKTGTSGTWRGVTAATNDVGILTGPKGQVVYVAVFIADSRAPEKDRATLMANIARLAATKY